MPRSQKKNSRTAIVMQLMQNVRIAVTTDTRERFAPLETLCVILALKEVILQKCVVLILIMLLQEKTRITPLQC